MRLLRKSVSFSFHKKIRYTSHDDRSALWQEIFAVRTEDIYQHPCFYTHDAMLKPCCNKIAIARLQSFRDVIDSHVKHAAFNIGRLAMRVTVHCSYGSLFKFY